MLNDGSAAPWQDELAKRIKDSGADDVIVNAPPQQGGPASFDRGWSRKCAYCGAASGTADVCCADCRRDPHAHCPSWPSCTYDWYGRPCDATR